MKSLIPAILLTIGLCASPRTGLAQVGEVRTVPLAVLNSAGRVHMGLTAQDFRVKGVKARISNVTFDAGPRRVILLLDSSGSMAAPADYQRKTRWQYAKEMAKTFVNDVPVQDTFALDVFAEKERQLIPFTHDVASIRAAIDALPEPNSKPAHAAYGKEWTYAGDALDAALRDSGGHLGFGGCIVLFSDGEFGADDAGRRSIESMTSDLERNGVRVFLALSLASGPIWRFAPPEDVYLPEIRNTSDFIAATGGFSFAPGIFPEPWPILPVYRVEPLEKRIATLYEAVQDTYRVRLLLDEPLRKKKRFHLEVIDGRGRPVRNVVELHPLSLYPSAADEH